MSYEMNNIKQVQANANVKYKALLMWLQEEATRRIERQGNGLGSEHHRAAAHDESRQCCCAHCQQGEYGGCLRARGAGTALT
eukprot:3728760-Pleurochrysis_carterae.AAC.1